MLDTDDCPTKGSQKLAYVHTCIYCQAETLKISLCEKIFFLFLWKDTNSYEMLMSARN